MTIDAAASSGATAKLWLVRHAQPLVEAGICYGASDIDADQGANRRVAASLALTLPQGIQILSSPLRRCRQLVLDLTALRPDLASRSDPRLAEMNFGCFEGQRWSDIPEAQIAHWMANFGKLRFGGLESVQDVMQRVAAVWDETTARQQDAVWLTHAGVIRAVNLISAGVRTVSRADQWPATPIKFGDVQTIELPRQPKRNLRGDQ